MRTNVRPWVRGLALHSMVVWAAVPLLSSCSPPKPWWWQESNVAPRAAKSLFRHVEPDDVDVLVLWGEGEGWRPLGIGASEASAIAIAVRDSTARLLEDPSPAKQASYGTMCMILLYTEAEARVLWLDSFGFSLGNHRRRFLNAPLADHLEKVFLSEGVLAGSRGVYIRGLLMIGAGRLSITTDIGAAESQQDLRALQQAEQKR